jgi:hypothetical protein
MSAVCPVPFVVYRRPSAFYRMTFAVCHLPSVVCHLPFAIYRLPSVVSCIVEQSIVKVEIAPDSLYCLNTRPE